MKPVPFAQYLAQKQLGGAGAAEAAAPSPGAPPSSWPPRQKSAGGEPPRTSPLLRRHDAAHPASRTGDAAEFRSLAEQKKTKAVEEARAAARQEMLENFAAERAQWQAQAEAQRAQDRVKWAEQEGARLAAAHRAALESFEQSCAQVVAGILRPFLAQREILRVTEALIGALETLFSARGVSLFEISGPPDLLTALETRFAAQKAHIRFKPADTVDVCVTVDDTILETQLGPWLEALGALSSGGADE